MTDREQIPLVIIEEHHEAFYVWRYAISKGWIPPKGNILFHVDEHHDLFRPTLRRPLREMTDLRAAAEVTYGDLSIGNFIWPAVSLGVFDKMFWLRLKHSWINKPWYGYIWPKDTREVDFVTRWRHTPETSVRVKGMEQLSLQLLHTTDEIEPDQAVILDIDLDYFACAPRQEGSYELEVTLEAFQDFLTNPYHFLRLRSGLKVKSMMRNGSHYLVFGRDAGDGDQKVDESVVDQRLDAFMSFLRNHRVQPRLIVLCRSAHSGYTPAENVSFILTRLLKDLSELYGARTFRLTDIISTDLIQNAARRRDQEWFQYSVNAASGFDAGGGG